MFLVYQYFWNVPNITVKLQYKIIFIFARHHYCKYTIIIISIFSYIIKNKSIFDVSCIMSTAGGLILERLPNGITYNNNDNL